MQTLYGNSFDSLAGQQQNYDRFNNDINQSNRADVERADREAAAYAFQRRQLENADEQTAANYYSGFSRDMAQMQQAKANRAEDASTNAYRFGVGQANQDRSFGLTEKQFELQKQLGTEDRARRMEEVDNAGNALAGALAETIPTRVAAEAHRAAAVEKLDALHANAQKEGLVFDARQKKYVGLSPLAPNFNQRLEDYQFQLKNANDEVRLANERTVPLERQARGGGFVVEPTGIRHERRGVFYPFAAPAQQAYSGQPSLAPSGARLQPFLPVPTGTAGAVTPPDDRGSDDLPTSNAGVSGYQSGRVYGGMRFLGGDPSDSANWKSVR